MNKGILGLVLGGLVLSACVRNPIESNPVVLYTDQGPLTCELYSDEIVWWDRSISRPETMSERIADKICYEEGERRYNALRNR